VTREQRRLAAIVAADVVGYSRLMGRDESATLAALKAVRRELIDPQVAAHGGRLVKTAGDSLLLEFHSVVDAMRCVVEIQTAMVARNADIAPEWRMLFRVGINIGDVIVDGDDVMGDVVNVAAHLQEIAPPGGACVAGHAHDYLRDRTDVLFEDGGLRQLKNIARPVPIWMWSPDGAAHAAPAAPPALPDFPLKLPDKPSIAVLPFANLSGDPEQEYFADGMVDDIIAALSRFKSLFVIARNSSFTYKGKFIDLKQVGRELGVRYVLQGSVRKAGERVRITGQLLDATTGMHLWTDRFEGDLSDIFAVQDEMTANVISAIAPTLLRTEIAVALRRPPENLTAYDLYLRAASHYYAMTPDGVAKALGLLSQSLEIDPGNAVVASMAGACHFHSAGQGWTREPQRALAEGTRLLELALSLDENDADALSIVGRVRAYMLGDFGGSMEMVDRAVSLNPNSALAWEQRGWTCVYAGRPEEAISSFERAIRLSPLDPFLFSRLTGMSLAHISLDRFAEAVELAQKAIRRNPDFSTTYRCLAAALAHLGRTQEAGAAAARLLELEPAFRVSQWVARAANWRAQSYIEGLRKAGLPE
jgi:adenylate cyclase